MSTPAPTRTPNSATTTRPERSSRRTAHRTPLGWLPWLLLALLALLVAATLLVINAVDDDGRDGPAGDSLGQASRSDGSGVDGADESASGAGTAGAEGEAPPAGGTAEGGGTDRGGTDQGGTDQGGTAEGGATVQGGATAKGGDLAGLTAGSLVGGAGIPPAPASQDAATAAQRDAGTAGTVLFAEGSAELDANAQQVIDRAGQGLEAAGATAVTVYGYTDVVAGEDVNVPLSQDRADVVAEALRGALPGVEVSTEARGQETPVASNDTEQGRQQNRRAAIVATG